MTRPMDKTVAIVLGGGRGTRLHPLTKYRSKPAVPLAGKYRLVDIPISNCINSGCFEIYVLTQFESASLNQHVSRTYMFDNFRGGHVEILAAEQRYGSETGWFQGTADAVRQTYRHTVKEHHEHVMILSGDALYRLDYSDVLDHHLRTRADVTVVSKTVGPESAPEFGIMGIDRETRITRFVEKPPADQLEGLAMDPVTREAFALDAARPYLASMGIYIFSRAVLDEYVRGTPLNDFGRDIIPDAVANRRVVAFPFKDYWEDIGTVAAFYEANLSLTDWKPEFNLYEPSAPIFTRRRFLPGAKILDCDITNVIIGEGAIITAARIFRSVIGIRSVVRAGATLENTIMMGADRYDEPAGAPAERTPLGVGENSIIRRAIIDLNVRVGRDVKIINVNRVTEAENDLFCVRDGIVILPKETTIPDGMVI